MSVPSDNSVYLLGQNEMFLPFGVPILQCDQNSQTPWQLRTDVIQSWTKLFQNHQWQTTRFVYTTLSLKVERLWFALKNSFRKSKVDLIGIDAHLGHILSYPPTITIRSLFPSKEILIYINGIKKIVIVKETDLPLTTLLTFACFLNFQYATDGSNFMLITGPNMVSLKPPCVFFNVTSINNRGT